MMYGSLLSGKIVREWQDLIILFRMMLEKPDDRPSMDSVFDFFNEKEQKYEAAQYAELSTESSKSPFALEIIRL